MAAAVRRIAIAGAWCRGVAASQSGQSAAPRRWSSRRTTAADSHTRSRRRRGAIPDLQGVWISDDATIPMSRPQNFGTGLYQTDEEWAARQKQIQQGIQQRRERHRLVPRRLRAPCVPPDLAHRRSAGRRTPAFTADARSGARRAIAARSATARSNTAEDFTLYDRCITRGIVGSVLRVVYGNGNRIVQAPGMVAISYEMIHDTRVFYTDGRPHTQPGSAVPRRFAGRWEGDDAGRRDDEPDRQDQHRPEWQRPAPQRQDQKKAHNQERRSVHDVDAADAARWRRSAALRVP